LREAQNADILFTQPGFLGFHHVEATRFNDPDETWRDQWTLPCRISSGSGQGYGIRVFKTEKFGNFCDIFAPYRHNSTPIRTKC